mgnify:CR=1 FL=1
MCSGNVKRKILSRLITTLLSNTIVLVRSAKERSLSLSPTANDTFGDLLSLKHLRCFTS